MSLHEQLRGPSPEHPTITLQTSNRFGDSDEGFGSGDPDEEAARHGREAVRAFNETVPDALKPHVHLQMEVRIRDHATRYERYRRILEPLQEAGLPAEIQASDPHDIYVFDPIHVEKLVEEFDCIKAVAITENRFEHFATFNVPRYAMPAQTAYAIDTIDMAARHGRHVIISLQDLKLMHVGADALNQPLMDAIFAHPDVVIPLNEHIGPRYIARQTATMGFWLSGAVNRFGVEPQSWWYENARMIEPGVFGQREPDNTRIMPPELYRAMILLGALTGATVYNFEPFWDLFDYDNSHCWRDVIAPTLIEVIERRLIPTREQVLAMTRVAYQYTEAGSIEAFHDILRDVDWIGDRGLLARAAYGLWGRYLEHELIPNTSRYFFIPLLPPKTPAAALAGFDEVLQTGQHDTEAAYRQALDRHYPEPDNPRGTAFTCSINGHTYVMQSHENLYERQTYEARLPKPVTGLRAERTRVGVRLTWEADPGAARYFVHRVHGQEWPHLPGFSRTIWRAAETELADPELRSLPETYHGEHGHHLCGSYLTPGLVGETTAAEWLDDAAASADEALTWTVTAETPTTDVRRGTVNYLDYVVFSETVSVPGEQVTLGPGTGRADGRPITDPPDARPASQMWHPVLDGAEGPNAALAREIVERIDEMKAAYEAADWRRMTALYAEDYSDANGFSREYVGRAWDWWFFRNDDFILLQQIRRWDFSRYDAAGLVRVRQFILGRCVRWDDDKFGNGWDGTVRVPRHRDEEVTFTWRRGTDGVWHIVATEPAFPCMAEMLWNSRGRHPSKGKLEPGREER